MSKEEPMPQEVIPQQVVLQETVQDIAEQNNMTPEEVEVELQEELSPEAVEVIEEVLNEDVLPQMPEDTNDMEVPHTDILYVISKFLTEHSNLTNAKDYAIVNM